MAAKGRKKTNELEFQGEVLGWLNHEIKRRPGLKIDRASQEKPRQTSGKRSDLIIWKDRSAEAAFLALELKTPDTSINDPVFFADAIEKAQHWSAPYFVIWNMREAELYPTPPKGGMVTPAGVLKRWPALTAVTKLEDWLRTNIADSLRRQAIDILEAAIGHAASGGQAGHVIDPEIFVARLSHALGHLREILYKEITQQAMASAKLRKTINTLAAQQGFRGFVEDTEFAIAGQIGYRLIGQILFYFALRRKQPSLKELTLNSGDKIPQALEPFWNDVRRFDYEALFQPQPIDTLVVMPDLGQILVRSLIESLSHYDWASLTDDVLGVVFERLIPHEEQVLLGQFYTPRPVADLLVALTVDGDRTVILDPGCGSGTFLMSAYGFLAARARLSHQEILAKVWGFDLSPFAAELAAINLFRQDLSEFENFPRIVPGNFFDRVPGQPVDFPPPRIKAGQASKIPVPIPHFDCIVGNPPYLRSQNQDDLDPGYRKQLFSAALKVGVEAEQKTDLFAFFIFHALRFMKPGARVGFVTPASWLTSNYATALQKLLMNDLRLIAIVASGAEAFFPQVQVNAVLLVAEMVDPKAKITGEPLRFVNLKRTIASLVEGADNIWDGIIGVADQILNADESYENDSMRVKLMPLASEREGLSSDPNTPRNWSKFMRAPLSYYQLFGDHA
ncbi:MAG: N-6 DNA methylase [Candidatus Hydrogenedentes bacterium]|nr:N-6 DNA methylase [Candidatus Hydrogenedentota bacterium]